MSSSMSRLESYLVRRRVLHFGLAEIVKRIGDNPISDELKAFYRDLLSQWYANTKALQESIAQLCESDEQFHKAMTDFSPLIQSYHDILEKLSKNHVVTTDTIKDTLRYTATAPLTDSIAVYTAAAKSLIHGTVKPDSLVNNYVGAIADSITIAGDFNVSFDLSKPLAGQRIYFNIREVPPSFYGRQSDLRILTAAFRDAVAVDGKKTNKTNTIIIHGMPGTGKTSLAAAFVRSCGEELKKFHVLWISAGSKRNIRDQFVQACELNFPGLQLRDEQGKLIKDEHLMSAIYNKLTQSPSLIVFDNAPSATKSYGIQEEIADFFCKSVRPDKHHPVYLITTLTGAPEVWKGCNGNMVELDVFSEEDCWSYMKKELPVLANHKSECQRLWKFFHRLPLAIEHAVNVMTYEASFCSDPATYNPQEFVRMTLAFQPPLTADVQGMDMKLYEKLDRLWEYSLTLLQNIPTIGAYAIQVLDIMSLLSSTGIPETFLLQILKGFKFTEHDQSQSPREETDKLVAKIMCLLTKFSVVQKTSHLLYVHVLMQKHRRKCLQHDSRLEKQVVSLVESMIVAPELTSYLKNSEWSHNFKNIQHVCDAMSEYVRNDASELKARCAKFVQDCLPQTALGLLPDGDDSLTTLKIKSSCYSNLGKYRQALQYRQDLYQKSELQFPDDSPQMLEIKNTLASDHSDLGDYTEALRLSKEVHDVLCRILGSDHPDTLVPKHNMANFYSHLGNYTKALQLSKEVYNDFGRILGPENPDTLSVMINMATFHANLGEYTEALLLIKEVYEISSRTLGEEHPTTLNAKSSMAIRRSELGEYEIALQLSQDVLEARSRVLGPEHPVTLITKNNMANWHSLIGQHNKAAGLSREVYDGFAATLGPEHPVTLSAKYNLAEIYSHLGDFSAALELSVQVHDARSRVLEPNHPDTLSTKNSIAVLHSHLGDYTTALQLSKQVHEARYRILGPKHPDTLSARVNMANRHLECGNYVEAMSFSKSAYAEMQEVLGEGHLDTQKAHTLMNRTCAELRDLYLLVKSVK